MASVIPATTTMLPLPTSSSSSSSSSYMDIMSQIEMNISRSLYIPAGPLTVVWTPTCSITTLRDLYGSVTPTSLSSDHWWATHARNPSCRPPGWQWPAGNRPYWKYQTEGPSSGQPVPGTLALGSNYIAPYYSPGICPSGYTPACSRPTWGDALKPSSLSESWAQSSYSSLFGPALTEGETATICIPTGWECPTGTRNIEVTGPTSIMTTSGKYTFQTQASAPWVQIRWAESDLPRLETHPLTSGRVMNTTLAYLAAVTSAQRAIASLQGKLGETRDGWEAEKELRSRITVGLAVPFAVLTFLLLGALFTLWMRYRKLMALNNGRNGNGNNGLGVPLTREMTETPSYSNTNADESSSFRPEQRQEGGDTATMAVPPPYSPREDRTGVS
ncbi:hypothetical protein PGQ11_014519 [Apiospora arundinis]|uniref:Uncharacterized protein n=1 Tax=Apiospora arundinis TaxID=335852 RepID=A0ABR2HT72_9PEZI